MRYYPCGDCIERDRCHREGRTNCKTYREWLKEKRDYARLSATEEQQVHTSESAVPSDSVADP